MPRLPEQKLTGSPIQWSLLVDGSALFFAQRAVCPEKNLNYIELNALLRGQVGSSLAPKPAYFFTAADEANEKQQKFHHLISDLGWTVRQFPPHEATVLNPLLGGQDVRVIRFDAMLAYCLGSLRHQAEHPHIFVISDSWPLAGPVRDCVLRGTPVTVVFFGQVIDTRWHRTFREAEAQRQPLSFLDLDMFPVKLFDRPRPSRRRDDDVLADLP
jgi:hypothetical protein